MVLLFGDAISRSRHSEISSTANTVCSSGSSGINSLKGMAKKTFGNISIRKKLASFQSVFPHDDNITVKNITGIYDDVLEFSRPGAYSESVTRTAWKLLVLQIASRKTQHLTQALAKMPFAELQPFISVLADRCITDVEESYDSLHRKGKNPTLSSSSKEVVALAPMLKFIAQIASQSDLACQTVLEAGILDILLRIYVIFPALSSSLPEDVGCKSTLMDACQLTVTVLCRLLEKPQMVYNHPVCMLWTDRDSERPDNPLQNRCGAWRRAPRSCTFRRLVVIHTGSLWRPNNDIVGGLEACMDIVEFTNSEHYDSDIVDMAFLTLLKQIVFCGDTAQHLINVLAEGSREDTVRVFSGVNHLWLECIALQVNSDMGARAEEEPEFVFISEDYQCIYVPEEVINHQTFHDRAKKDLHQKIVEVDIALFRILQFATQAAKQNTTIRLGMLDAGTLVLVLTAFANHDFRLAGLVSTPGHGLRAKGAKPSGGESIDAKVSFPLPLPISVSAMNAGASTLLVSMRYATFREFWGDQRFNTRLSLCSSLVGSLLGGDGDPGGSRETRSLFKEIVGL